MRRYDSRTMLADTPFKSRFVALNDRWRFGWAKLLYRLGVDAGVPGLVTVVIPALESRADLLGRQALPSVARQSYSKLEVIVVSEHYSPEIQGHLQASGLQFRYFWGVKKSKRLMRAGHLAVWSSGAIPSLNLGHRKARGEFIARLDDDDMWLENHLENALTCLAKEGADFLSSRALAAEGGYLPELALSDKTFGTVYRWLVPTEVVGTPITWVYRRPVSKIRYNPKSWLKRINRPADYDLMLRLAAARVAMTFSPQVTARQLLRPDTAGRTGSVAYLAEHGDAPQE